MFGLLLFLEGVEIHSTFCSPRELGILPHGKKEVARTVAYIIFFVGVFT